MIRTLVLVACLAAAAHGFDLSWNDEAFLVKFGMTGIGSTTFMPQPITKANATAQGYVAYERPTIPDGYSSLVMYCPGSGDLTSCMMYDDTGYIAGYNIALNKEHVSSPAYDWEEQGYTSWTTTLPNGTTFSYWTMQLYLVSPETLAIDAETRIASRVSTTILQDTALWVTGFDGELFSIPTNFTEMTASSNIYTKQACIPWMGHHYYYNMTSSTECGSKKIFSWFPLWYSNQLVGIGFMLFAKSLVTNSYCEYPSQTAVKVIVPNASNCFYEMAESPGVITRHIYFVDPAWTITCIVEDS